MDMALIYALISALAVSAVSVIGILFLFSKENLHGLKVHIFLALAAGAMLGNAILHLAPHALTLEHQAIESGHPPAIVEMISGMHEKVVEHPTGNVAEDHHHHDDGDEDVHHQDATNNGSHGHTGMFTCLMIMLGLGLFGTMDLWLQRSRSVQKEGVASEAYMVVINDIVENLLDGVVIGTAYLLSPAAGFAATVTIFLHEIPLELGDFAVMRHSGFSQRKAITINLLSGLVSVVGVLVAVVLGMTLDGFALYATPLAAGGFIYIAASVLIPKLKNQCCDNTRLYMLMCGVGVALMMALTFFE